MLRSWLRCTALHWTVLWWESMGKREVEGGREGEVSMNEAMGEVRRAAHAVAAK